MLIINKKINLFLFVYFSVVLAAEHDIKRLTVAVDWNLMQHVQSLFEFFLGTLKTIKQPVRF